MVSAALELLGLALSVAGSLLGMAACGLPMWKVSAYIEGNIVTAQTVWEGLWMSCVVQSTGQMQCKVHDSMLALEAELQASRALTVLAGLLGALALLLAVSGAQCTNCVRSAGAKARVVSAGGALYVLCGVLALVPPCWTAHRVVADFYNPLVPTAQKREMGAALYVGWAASALLMAGGAVLCCSCPAALGETRAHPGKLAMSSGARAPTSVTGDYGKRNYV